MKKPEDIYILVGCEESQAIILAFRKLGVKAFSCDLKKCSGGHPEWHIQCDVFKAIKGGHLTTESGDIIFINKWDAGIFHPDCTYLTVSGLHWNGRIPGRTEKTEKALRFVCDLLNSKIPNMCIENPVGCISTRVFKSSLPKEDNLDEYLVLPFGVRPYAPMLKPSQIIQPYEFGDDASKKTCLWLKGFPLLKPTTRFYGRIVNGKERFSNQTDSGQNKLGPSDDRAELRSRTYVGIAEAIATQWTNYLLNKTDLSLF